MVRLSYHYFSFEDNLLNITVEIDSIKVLNETNLNIIEEYYFEGLVENSYS